MFPLSPYAEARGGGAGAGGDDAEGNETENYEALLSLAERLGEAKPRGELTFEDLDRKGCTRECKCGCTRCSEWNK